jgi:hypothetical protein
MSNNTKTPFKNIENQYIFSKKKHFFAKKTIISRKPSVRLMQTYIKLTLVQCKFGANLHQTYTYGV